MSTFFEDDIALTLSQAEEILQDLTPKPRRKRKLAEPIAKRWALPIPYSFDGRHSKLSGKPLSIIYTYNTPVNVILQGAAETSNTI